MLTLRPASERGHADHGWLQACHSFSFADYHDPAHMGWSVLRVINEDRVAPGSGFGMHGHRDMEIVTWVLSGTLEHKDSLGNGGLIRPGEVQRMSAGKGILHSEFNPSPDEPTHLLQIWLLPAERGTRPSWEQITLPEGALDGRLQPIATPDGAGGSTRIGQDAAIHAARLAAGQTLALPIDPARNGWLQVARGELRVNEQNLGAGDGLGVSGEALLNITASAAAEFLWFDLPGGPV